MEMLNTIGFFFNEDLGGSNGLCGDLSSDCKTATLAAMFTELNKRAIFNRQYKCRTYEEYTVPNLGYGCGKWKRRFA